MYLRKCMNVNICCYVSSFAMVLKIQGSLVYQQTEKRFVSVPSSSSTPVTFPPNQHHSKPSWKSSQEWILDPGDKQNYGLPSHILNTKIFLKVILSRITFLFFFFSL